MATPLLRPSFVRFDDTIETREQLFDVMGQELIDAGIVAPTYIAVLAEREDKYPTGLRTRPAAIAIPHTPPEHVLQPAISVRRLAHPVTFREMGIDRYVDAALIFMLCLPDGKSQLATLQRLMSIVASADALTALMETDTEEQLYQHLHVALSDDGTTQTTPTTKGNDQ